MRQIGNCQNLVIGELKIKGLPLIYADYVI